MFLKKTLISEKKTTFFSKKTPFSKKKKWFKTYLKKQPWLRKLF